MFKKVFKEDLSSDSTTNQNSLLYSADHDIYGKFYVKSAIRTSLHDSKSLKNIRSLPESSSSKKKLLLTTKSSFQVPGVGSYNISTSWIKPSFHSPSSEIRSKSTLPKLKESKDRPVLFKKTANTNESKNEEGSLKTQTNSNKKSRESYSKLPAEQNRKCPELIWEKVKLQGNPEQLNDTLKFHHHRNMIENTKKHIQSLKSKLKSKYRNYLVAYY